MVHTIFFGNGHVVTKLEMCVSRNNVYECWLLAIENIGNLVMCKIKCSFYIKYNFYLFF